MLDDDDDDDDLMGYNMNKILCTFLLFYQTLLMDENFQMFRGRTVKLYIQQEHFPYFIFRQLLFHSTYMIQDHWVGSIRNVENASFRSIDGKMRH
jgi:hypothetical protein